VEYFGILCIREGEAECLFGGADIKIEIIMKLPELSNYLTNPNLIEGLYENLGISTESEALLIYMKDALDIKSDIKIFEIEETDDDLIFEKDGIFYYQLFPIEYAIELIEYDLNLKDKGYSNSEIAEKLLEYRQNDA
jgi:hypothetical protein